MSKMFVSGHRGMVGSALVRALRAQNSENQLLLADRTELDLLNQAAVEGFIEKHKPDIVINAAAKVGGIHANDTYPAEFIHQNLLINSNLIHAAWQSGVGRFLNLGSSCIYPRACPGRSRRNICLLVRWRKQTKPMLWPKLQDLKCADITEINTEHFFIVLCPPICTVLR